MGLSLVSEAVRFSKSRGAVVQRSETTSPTSTPKLLLSTGPVFSCKGIAKGTRFKSTIVIVILSNTDILDLQTSFSILDKQLKTALGTTISDNYNLDNQSSIYATNMPKKCPRNAQYLPKICQKFVQDMQKIC